MSLTLLLVLRQKSMILIRNTAGQRGLEILLLEKGEYLQPRQVSVSFLDSFWVAVILGYIYFVVYLGDLNFQ